MNENTYSPYPKTAANIDDEDSINIQQLIQLCTSHWYWFLISIIIALTLATAYILKTQPTYTQYASVLIKDTDPNRNITKAFGAFTSMGSSFSRINIHNEMLTFKSPTYMVDVVNQLHLDMNYSVDGRFHAVELYGANLPIQIVMPDLKENDRASLDVKLTSDGNAILSNFKLNFQPVSEKNYLARLGTVVQTPIGKLMITPTQVYDGTAWDRPIHVFHSTIKDATNRYVGALAVEQSDDRSSVIDLRISDVSSERAADVLANLLQVYDKKWVDNINEQAVNTSKFIDEELKTIEAELGLVDASISSYKSSNMVPDIAAASQIYMQRAETNRAQLMDLTNQLFMANYIKKQLTSDGSKNKTLPANSGLSNTVVSQQIVAYNDLVIQRNNLINNSGANNPLIQDLDQNIASMRQAILASVENTVAELSDRISLYKGNESQTNRQISSSPSQAKDLLGVERQQKVKEQLYLFLLQKKEENQLSKAFTAYNSLVLNPPYGSLRPTSPVKLNVILVALLLGIFIPLVLLLLRHTMDNAIHNRKDLEALTIPFIGEIPLSYRKRKGLLSVLNKRNEVREIVVKEQSGNAINESFRVVRSNLEFVLGQSDKAKIVMFTSAYAGSGKTFISANLATSFAIKGKKTLLIDFDLRKASLSTFINSPSQGISDYLTGHVKDLSEIMVKGTINPNLDVIPVGTNPPNPTELLFTDRFNNLFDFLSDKYDYIFVDCPPIDVVADAAIINKFTDLTIFVIRAGLFEKTMIPELERNYTEERFKNLTIILNGTYDTFNGYGYHSYGYGYGYGYGEKKK